MKKKVIKFIVFLSSSGIFLLLICLIAILAAFSAQQGVASKESKDGRSGTLNRGELTAETSLTLSAEVEFYRDQIALEAAANNISEYTDLLLCIVMQESAGKYTDIFQCSESLGRPPNSITTEESIVQGVSYFAGILKDVGVTDPNDILNLRIALQAYNFGSGFVSYAKNNGGWSQEVVDAFAKDKSKGVQRTGIAAERQGKWKYGDQYYTDHVLRYYSIDNGSDILEYAYQFIGYPYVWGASGPTAFDCSGFVYYVYKNTGTYTGARTTAAGYRSLATSITESDARPGDLVFFSNAGRVHHIGIYIGNGQMIHAPKPGDSVKVATIYRDTDVVTFGRLRN